MTTARDRQRAKKRGNGEGSISLRQDGRWEARVRLPNGKRPTVYGETRKEVQDKLRELNRSIEQGVQVGVKRPTLRQFLEQWLEEVVKPNNAFKTYQSYSQTCRNHIIPMLGTVPIDKLTAQDVQSFYTKKTRQGASANTVRYCRIVLRIALNQAVRWRLVSYNAAAVTTPPRVERKQVRAMEFDEAQAILNTFKGNRLEPLVATGLMCGLRQGELLGLRWSQVDLDDAVIAVRFQVQKQDGAWVFKETKSRESRTVDIPEFVVDMLRAHRTSQKEDRLKAGSLWQDYDLVFPTEVGTPHDRLNITHRFQRQLKRAGLGHMRFHDLRHGAATLMLAQGEELKVVSEVLGHSQTSTTLNIYAHAMRARKRQAAGRLQQQFGTA